MSAPDPKPEVRIRASLVEWGALHVEKMGYCYGCGADGETLHHLVGRGVGGDDVADNLIPLCGHGSVGCHGVITSHNRDGASGLTYPEVAHAVRVSLTLPEVGYVLRKKGRDWLDELYPSGDVGPLCARCRRQLTPEKSGEQKTPRPRKQKTISVPADELENGLDAFDALLIACDEELVRARGGEPRSAYYTLMDVMAFFVTTPKEAADAA